MGSQLDGTIAGRNYSKTAVIIDDNSGDLAGLNLCYHIADVQWALPGWLLLNIEIDHGHNSYEQQQVYNVGLITRFHLDLLSVKTDYTNL
jgi:hypothetical protein